MSIPASVVSALAERGFDPSDLEGVMVSMSDVREAGFCAPGLRSWMNEHGFDLRALTRGEIPAEDVAMTGDAYAVRVLIHRLERSV